MVTPKERKLLTNLRDIKGRKIWVLCSWRSQSEEDIVLELFLRADCSMCLKFVCLAGGILEIRSLLLSSRLSISLLLLFSKQRSRFQSPSAFPNTSLVPHLFHFLFLFRPVCTPLNGKPFLLPMCMPYLACSSWCCFYYLPSSSWHLQVCLGLFSSCFPKLLS